MPADLSAQHEVIMAQIRGSVSEIKVAAISAILYSEEQPNIARQNMKLHDAIQWLVQEIAQNDPRVGLKIKAQIDAIMEQATQGEPAAIEVVAPEQLDVVKEADQPAVNMWDKAYQDEQRIMHEEEQTKAAGESKRKPEWGDRSDNSLEAQQRKREEFRRERDQTPTPDAE